MAQFSIVAHHQLDAGVILAPERYDPRRTSVAVTGVSLNTIVEIVNDQVQPRLETPGRCVVLDTGDAREGIIRSKDETINWSEIGSAKKILRKGDVIISRLRPYLRQVAFIDGIQAASVGDDDAPLLLCSTEFFVLRSRDDQPIAFLVPFLLSDPVQRMLGASQEGGHHPRFNQDVLKQLILPTSLLIQRLVISQQIIEAVRYVRQSEDLMNSAIKYAKNIFLSEQ